MLPAPLIAAFAPMVADAIKGKAKDAGPVGEVVASLLASSGEHERRKASVRPMVLKMTGTLSVLIAAAGVVAALSPILFDTPQATSDAMVMNLLYLFGATSGAYTVGATKRTIEKVKGAS